MATTQISDLWNPAVWQQSMREPLEKLPSIINSGVVTRPPRLTEVATGPGTTANIPLWKDITDTDGEEIQVEGTAPTTTHNVTAGTQICTVLNRVKRFGVEALAAAVSGEDPVAEITSQLAMNRLKRRQNTLIATLRGLFGTYDQTPDEAEGCLKALRADHFLEDGTAATGSQLIDAEKVIYAIGLMGELRDQLSNGAMLVHSTIASALEVLDKDSFKDGVESGLPFRVRTYRGIPIFMSDLLSRSGATSGNVYETFILPPGVIGIGEKPQVADTGETVDVAALQLRADKDKNQTFLWDRTRFVMHVVGTKWTGTPGGQSATNAELQTATNWALVASSAKRIGGVVIRTNG